MEIHFEKLQEALNKLVGLHRQLLELVRSEKDAIVAADLKLIQDTSHAKEILVEAIKTTETRRLEELGKIALTLRRPMKELSLSELAIVIQARDPKRADHLRSVQNALKLLVDRVVEQNRYNAELVSRSLESLTEMKANVLGEGVRQAQTYGQNAQKVTPSQSAPRMLSQEA
jgi:hypothetical protein